LDVDEDADILASCGARDDEAAQAAKPELFCVHGHSEISLLASRLEAFEKAQERTIRPSKY
jgi:hypothetical protein